MFSVLSKLKIHAAGDIGCYTLGAVAPLSVIDTTICMGASISALHGMEKARGRQWLSQKKDGAHSCIHRELSVVPGTMHYDFMITLNG